MFWAMTFGKLHRICDQKSEPGPKLDAQFYLRSITPHVSPIYFCLCLTLLFEQAVNLGVSVQTHNEYVVIFC
jgi:hypothetical protein